MCRPPASEVVEAACCSGFLLYPFGGRLPGTEGLRLSGAALLKHRQLWAAGYRVVSIPYYEFVRLPSLQERSAYLQKKIRALLR